MTDEIKEALDQADGYYELMLRSTGDKADELYRKLVQTYVEIEKLLGKQYKKRVEAYNRLLVIGGK